MFVKGVIGFAVILFVLSGCEGSGGSGSSKTEQGVVRTKSPLLLEAASLEYSAELIWNQERFPGAKFNLCYAEELLETKSSRSNPENCFFHDKATILKDQVSPMTVFGLDGGQRYRMQLEAVKSSGETLFSAAILVTPSIFDEELLGVDDWDWQSAPDLETETSFIAQRAAVFQQAMINKDVTAATAVIAENQRDVYEALFNNNPDAMPAFGALLDQARISFLAPPEDPEGDTMARIAEYEIEIDGFTFYFRWIKDGDTWVLFDF